MLRNNADVTKMFLLCIFRMGHFTSEIKKKKIKKAQAAGEPRAAPGAGNVPLERRRVQES